MTPKKGDQNDKKKTNQMKKRKHSPGNNTGRSSPNVCNASSKVVVSVNELVPQAKAISHHVMEKGLLFSLD